MAALSQLNRNAFVSPTINGHTVVYDQECDEQNFDIIEEFGCKLTETLSCAALAAVLHDDDVLYLWLFERGQISDHYNSLPQYFDPDAEPGPPEGGDSELICRAFDKVGHEARIETLLGADLLQGELPEILGELERHQALAHELGIPSCAVAIGFAAIAEGDIPDEFKQLVFESASQTPMS